MAKSNLSFSVSLESPVAVYVQIENQVQFAILSGRVKTGETLPSVRDMSAMLDINPNTVTKAYRDLELMGFVHTRRGVGVTVSDKAMKICKDRTEPMVLMHMRETVGECLASGMSGAEIKKLVNDAIDAGVQPYQPDNAKKK